MIFLELFWTFLKIGAFTFGGGYAMLPLIQSEVARHGWMTNAQLVDFVAVSESTPGPFAVNISTYVGMVTGGPLGAVCATLGVVLPSFLIILLVARCFVRFQSSRVVQGCLSGLRPAVVGLIAAAVASVGLTVFFPWRVPPGVRANTWHSGGPGDLPPVPDSGVPQGSPHRRHLPVRPFGHRRRLLGLM